MPAPTWVRRIGVSLNNNSTTVLSGVAIGGVITTAVLSAKAGIKSAKRLEQYAELEEETPSNKDKIDLCWRYWVPAGVAGTATIACIIGSNQIGLRRHAAMVGAYTLAETAFREYKEQVVNQIGDIKERGIRDKVAIQQMEKNPPKDAQVIITGGGEQLCFDTLTGRYFRSDAETIRRAENEVNRRVLVDMYAAHNEFYDLLELAPTVVGDELGWNIDNTMDLSFTAHLSKDGQPALAINYTRLPLPNYFKL